MTEFVNEELHRRVLHHHIWKQKICVNAAENPNMNAICSLLFSIFFFLRLTAIQPWTRPISSVLLFSILSHYVGYYGACNRQARVLKRSMVDPMFKTLFLCVSVCVLETCGCCNAVWRSKAASQTSSINKKTTALQGLYRLNGSTNCYTVSSLLCHLETLNTANPPVIFQYFWSYVPFLKKHYKH